MFDRLAPLYEPAMRVVRLSHEEAVRLLASKPDDLVLDVGGGTGIGARAAIRLMGCRAIILDRSAPMLRHARRSERLSLVQGDARRLPFGDGSIDGALCLDALHHFRDPLAALCEIRRTLKPGGRVVIAELDVRRFPIRVLGRLERLFGEPGTFWAPAQLQGMIVEAGLRLGFTQASGLTLVIGAERGGASLSEVSK